MNYKLLVNIAVKTGEIMLRSGAEICRVEDTISRILGLSQFETIEAFVIPTGIMVTLDDASVNAISLVKRVESRANNLNRVYLANDISRKLCSGEITLEEAYENLLKIEKMNQYPQYLVNICTIVCTIFFVILLGGSGVAFPIAMLNGVFIVVFRQLFLNTSSNEFIPNLLASFCIAVTTMIFYHVLKHNMQTDLIIIGSIMPMMPGVAITNAIRDTLHGDYMSGGARAIEAFIAAASLAVGIGSGLSLYAMLAGGVL